MTAAQRRLIRDAIDARARGVGRCRVPNGRCVYCGGQARTNSLVCAGHADLPALDGMLSRPKWNIDTELAAELNDTIQAERQRRKRKAVT